MEAALHPGGKTAMRRNWNVYQADRTSGITKKENDSSTFRSAPIGLREGGFRDHREENAAQREDPKTIFPDHTVTEKGMSIVWI